jgi:hypothetical protein
LQASKTSAEEGARCCCEGKGVGGTYG